MFKSYGDFRSEKREAGMIQSIFLSEPLTAYGSISEIDPVRVGEISEDRSATVGRNNWCFIYEGSNNYRCAYHDISLTPLGDQWARLIEERQRRCEALGLRFVQLIVPNKATLMPQNFPAPIGTGITKVLQRLLMAAPAANLVCPVEQMRQSGLSEVIFRRNDSHLTVAGNAMLAELILKALSFAPVGVPFMEVSRVNHTGDLGSKFRVVVSEAFCAPRFDAGLLDESRIEKIDETIVEGFNGTQQSFNNFVAPIKKKVLVIGNSFFERIPSWGMSPVFAALFEKYTMFWSADFDIELIEKHRPDVIISQTCERFLTRLPKA